MNTTALSQKKLSISFVESTFLISILGAARFSFLVSGVHLKIVFLFLIFSFVTRFFNKKIKFSLLEILFFLLFFGGGAGAIYSSVDMAISAYYLCWEFFSFIVIYGVFKSITKEYGFYFISRCYLYSFRIQIIISAVFYLLLKTEDGRISLYYYEPSYYAIAAIPYVCIAISSLFDRTVKNLWLDLFLVAVLLIVTKSANLMLIIMLTFTFLFFFSKQIKFFKKLKVVSILIFVCFAFGLTIFILNENNLIISSAYNILTSDNALDAILLRTGNRWPRIELTLDVIRHVFPYGIGPGTFKDFTFFYIPHTDYSHGIPWLNPVGKPAVCIWLEVLVECGLLGALGFYGLSLLVLWKAISILKNKNMLMPLCTLLVFCISLSFESSYLRLYFWAFLGIVGGIYLYEKKYEIR